MKNSRKKIIAQIAQMDKLLHDQKKELVAHKEYFVQSRNSCYYLAIAVFLCSAFFIGWNSERKQWIGRLLEQIVEVGTLVFVGYFKKMLFVLFESK